MINIINMPKVNQYYFEKSHSLYTKSKHYVSGDCVNSDKFSSITLPKPVPGSQLQIRNGAYVDYRILA